MKTARPKAWSILLIALSTALLASCIQSKPPKVHMPDLMNVTDLAGNYVFQTTKGAKNKGTVVNDGGLYKLTILNDDNSVDRWNFFLMPSFKEGYLIVMESGVTNKANSDRLAIYGLLEHQGNLNWTMKTFEPKKQPVGAANQDAINAARAAGVEMFQNSLGSYVIRGNVSTGDLKRLFGSQDFLNQLNAELIYTIFRDDPRPANPGGNATQNGGNSATERLKTLKELYDNGFITEDDYELKKNQILKDL